MNKRSLTSLVLTVALAAACGGDEAPPAPETSQEPAAQTPAPAVADTQPTEPETPPPAERPAAAPSGTILASSLGARVYTIQVGAFGRGTNASRLAERLRAEGLPAWEVRATPMGTQVTRVRVGATTSRTDVNRLGEIVGRRSGLTYWVAPVEPSTQLPAGIVEQTRQALGG